jgi:hypothetical protein
MEIIYECRDCGKFVNESDVIELRRIPKLSDEIEKFYYCKDCVEKKRSKQR